MSLANRPVVLVNRTHLLLRNDHVETMFRMGLSVHLLTEDEVALSDPRYTTARILPTGTSTDELTDEIVAELRRTGAAFAVTFRETDIVAVGRANQGHGVRWSRPDSDETARDKSLQRAHLRMHGMPSPASIDVRNPKVDDAVYAQVGFPCVIKPTRGAGSAGVELVTDAARATALLEDILHIAITGEENYYDGVPETWALIEEYLPGEEITCDGIVIDGQFYLGGIHTKVLPNPPWFDEDLYALPYGDQATEGSVCMLMTNLTSSLDLDLAIVNAELRRDADGHFRFVEFSTRISGGHVYRNIRDVHALDLVEIFLRAAFGDRQYAHQLAQSRHPGRIATCIKFIYRTGVVTENSAGDALQNQYFREYYPMSLPGESVWGAPDGFLPCGLLSVWGPYDPADHPAQIHRAAAECAAQLRLRVAPFG